MYIYTHMCIHIYGAVVRTACPRAANRHYAGMYIYVCTCIDK